MIFDEFRREFKRLDPVFTDFEWGSKYKYALFLAQVFHFVKHSSRIMSAVASRLPHSHEKIHSMLLQHANEEKGHQFLAVTDLKALGYKVSDLPELNSTRCFYETQYCKALFGNPIAFYGYALTLEGTAVMRLKEVYSKCKEFHGDSASHFFKVHSVDDDQHVETAIRELDKLGDEDRAEIIQNLSQSTYAFIKMFEEINEVGAVAKNQTSIKDAG
ncbi:MAG: iron-containing redox enzyme family protein [Bdellovibrionales bacterium]|nr:iron-containing redox enzyme family protein [Bdellovibrionales bacterium]